LPRGASKTYHANFKTQRTIKKDITMIDYLEKSKSRTNRQREKLAKVELCLIHKGFRALFHYVKSGMRKRATHLAHFQSFYFYVGNVTYNVSTYQLNAMAVDNIDGAVRLFRLAMGQKTKNMKRSIAHLAPICASYDFCPVH